PRCARCSPGLRGAARRPGGRGCAHGTRAGRRGVRVFRRDRRALPGAPPSDGRPRTTLTPWRRRRGALACAMGTPPPPGSWLRTLRARYPLLGAGLVAAALLVTAGCKRGAAPHPQDRGGETATSAPSSSEKTAPAAAEEKDPAAADEAGPEVLLLATTAIEKTSRAAAEAKDQAAADEAGLEVLVLAPPGSQGQPLPWVAVIHGHGDTQQNYAQFSGGLPIARRIYVFPAP